MLHKIKQNKVVRWPLFSETGLDDPWRENDDEFDRPSSPVGSRMPSIFVFHRNIQKPGVWWSFKSQI